MNRDRSIASGAATFGDILGGLALAATALLLSTSVAASERDQAPMIGLDGAQTDACGGIGSVTTWEADLPVREQPDDYAREKDRLPIRTLVWLCEAAGDWQGIVYATGEFQELDDCRVSSPVAEPRRYAGPCAFGWVAARNLSLVAG